MEDEGCRRCFQVRSNNVFNFHVWKPGRDGTVEVIVLMKGTNEKFKIWKGTIDFLKEDVMGNIPDKAWLVKEAWEDFNEGIFHGGRGKALSEGRVSVDSGGLDIMFDLKAHPTGKRDYSYTVRCALVHDEREEQGWLFLLTEQSLAHCKSNERVKRENMQLKSNLQKANVAVEESMEKMIKQENTLVSNFVDLLNAKKKRIEELHKIIEEYKTSEQAMSSRKSSFKRKHAANKNDNTVGSASQEKRPRKSAQHTSIKNRKGCSSSLSSQAVEKPLPSTKAEEQPDRLPSSLSYLTNHRSNEVQSETQYQSIEIYDDGDGSDDALLQQASSTYSSSNVASLDSKSSCIDLRPEAKAFDSSDFF